MGVRSGEDGVISPHFIALSTRGFTGGMVIKINCNQRYATDGVSACIFKVSDIHTATYTRTYTYR